jgi:hypothetical protein
MRKIEQLIEAVEYAVEEDLYWWEVFDSKKQAKKVFNLAKKEMPEESQLICVLEAREIDPFNFSSLTHAFNYLLKELKEELEE